MPYFKKGREPGIKRRFSSKYVAVCGLMLALTVALSFLEGLFPPIPFLPAGVKMGFANLPLLLCVFWELPSLGIGLVLVKSLSALVTGGLISALFSFSGSVCSFLLMLFLSKGFRSLSVAAISIAGALCSNLVQTCLAGILYQTAGFLFYLPTLIPFSVLFGVIIGGIWHLLSFRLEGLRHQIFSSKREEKQQKTPV